MREALSTVWLRAHLGLSSLVLGGRSLGVGMSAAPGEGRRGPEQGPRLLCVRNNAWGILCSHSYLKK